MTFFLALYAVLLVVGFAGLSREVQRSQLFFGMTLALFIALVGLRYETADYGSYVREFYTINSAQDFGDALSGFRDPGYSAVSWLVGNAGGGPQVMFFLIAIFSVGIKFYCYRRAAPLFYVALLGYVGLNYFGKDLGQMRNAFASALVLFSLVMLYDKRRWLWLAAVSVGGTIHAAALVAYGTAVARWLSNTTFLLILLSVSVLVLFIGGIGFALSDVFVQTFDSNIAERLARYQAKEGNGAPRFGGTVTISLCSAVLFLVFRRGMETASKYNIILLPVFVYGVVAFIALRDFDILSSRLRELLSMPIEPILWSSFVASFDKESRPLVYFGVAAYMSAWFVAWLIYIEPRYGFYLFQ